MFSKTIYKPTWLYIKQHNQTGLKYFGKTIQDPYKYKGSGKYWLRHLTTHSNDVTTLWTKRFDSQEELVAYALQFSQQHRIVESNEWANLVVENGVGAGMPGKDNGFYGKQHTEETRRKMKEKRKLQVISDETRCKLSEAAKGKPSPLKGSTISDERKAKISATTKGRPANNKGKVMGHRGRSQAKVTCPHCGKEGGICVMKRHHFDNCKLADFGPTVG